MNTNRFKNGLFYLCLIRPTQSATNFKVRSHNVIHSYGLSQSYSFGVLFINVFAPLMLAKRSARSSLSFIPAPFSASLSSAVSEVPPISLVRASPSSGVGRASFSLAPKFSTGPTLYPPRDDSTLKSSSYSFAYLYLSPPFF